MERVFEYMQWPVISIGDGSSVAVARAKLGYYNIDRLPVIDVASQLVGIVSTMDLANADQEGSMSDYKTHDVISIAPLASLDEAAELLYEHDIGGLPVTVDNFVVGVLTWGDFESQDTENGHSSRNLRGIAI